MSDAVVGLDRSPLGQLLYEPDRQQALAALRRSSRLGGLSDDAVQQALACLAKDEQLRAASGRWTPGRPDPETFVPGDVAAVRAGAGKPILISGWRLLDGQGRMRIQLERRDLLQRPLKALDLVELTSAVPYFLPTSAALGVLASHPPDQQLQQQLRLPFPRVLVLFGNDLELDPHVYRWPADYPYQQLPRHSITHQLIDRGGYVSGMVLLADQHARLRDDLLWIVAANPDPTLPAPAHLDRVRGVIRGWRSAATLGPLVMNVAAAVAWGAWQPPTTPLPLPEDPTSRAWRKAVRRGVFRRREPRGDAVSVHVLDLGRAPVQRHGAAPEQTTSMPSRHAPIPHLRGGHFRRVRVGPRHDWHYEVRWIAPTLVRGEQPDPNRMVVRRLPPPPVGGQDRDSPKAPTVGERLQGADPPFVGPPRLSDPRSLELP